MSNKREGRKAEKSLLEIRRDQPRVNYEQAMSQHQRMMNAMPEGAETRESAPAQGRREGSRAEGSSSS
jgi:hypothetical protein